MNIEYAARSAFAGAGVDEAERLARLAAEEAAAAKTLPPDGVPLNLPAGEMVLLAAALAVRLLGELPHYLCKALAASIRDTELLGQELREYVRAHYALKRMPEMVQLICIQLERLRQGTFFEEPCRVEMIKSAYRDGFQYEKHCRGCAQCTIAAMFKISGKEETHLFRAANGFAAGMGLFGDGVCGGYAGGLLFMGTYAGRRFEYFDNDKEEKDQSMHLAELLHSRFIETYGSVICHDIHRQIFGRAFFIRDADEKAAFEQAGAHTADKCTAVVATAAAWTAEILLDEGYLTC